MPWNYLWSGSSVVLGKEYPFDQATKNTADALTALIAVESKVTCIAISAPNKAVIVITDIAADESACDTVMASYAP